MSAMACLLACALFVQAGATDAPAGASGDERRPDAPPPHGDLALGAGFTLFHGLYVSFALNEQVDDASQPRHELVYQATALLGLGRGSKAVSVKRGAVRHLVVRVPVGCLGLTLHTLATPRAEAAWDSLLSEIGDEPPAPDDARP